VNQLLTEGIVLSRTDYGEADRILTLLTPEQGKLRLMARGVRRAKSKLAGGIELFSTTQISYMHGRGEIGTLISARLIKYYDQIVRDIDRVQRGYELIKMLNKATEDQPEAEYFELLQQAFTALNDHAIDVQLIRLWFSAQLLRQAGHRPNLQTTAAGDKLQSGQAYNFDFDDVSFAPHPAGHFTSDDIKFLRLIFSGNQPYILAKVQHGDELVSASLPLVQTMLQTYIRL
jgi:DNA repair protein RecO